MWHQGRHICEGEILRWNKGKRKTKFRVLQQAYVLTAHGAATVVSDGADAVNLGLLVQAVLVAALEASRRDLPRVVQKQYNEAAAPANGTNRVM